MGESGKATFAAADYVVFIASLLLSLGIGVFHWWRARGKDNSDFLLGGRKMSPIPVAISLFAGMVSAVSILGNSSEMYYHGSQLWMNVVGTAIGTLVASILIIPILYPLNLVSVYEIFEHRWNSALLRKMAMILHTLNMTLYLGIALYAPSLALSSVTPIPTKISVVMLGLICTVYASLGGAKAVVYTDTVQAFIMLSGIIIVIAQGCKEVEGAAASWAIDEEYGRIEFFNMSADPLERHTFMSTMILGIYFGISNYGASQSQYQRWTSVATIKQTYIVVIISCSILISIWSLINYSGLVVFSVYAHCDPLTAGYISKIDQITPYFVIDKLGYLPGIPGLFVAAIYSGVLSTVSSILNAMSANVWEDILSSLKYFSNYTSSQAKKVTIIISCIAGVVATIMGILAGSMGGVFQMSYALTGAIGGPVTGLFLTAVTCPWVKNKSAFLGVLLSITLTSWMVMGSHLYAPPSPKLPLYTDGCPGYNTTTTMSPVTDMTSTIVSTTDGGGDGDYVFPLYLVSYCLYGAIGAATTFVMSNVATLIFGAMDVSKVSEKTVHKKALDFYRWIRRVSGKSDSSSKRQESETGKELEAVRVSITESKSGKELETVKVSVKGSDIGKQLETAEVSVKESDSGKELDTSIKELDSSKELETVEVSVKESDSGKELETAEVSVKHSDSGKELETSIKESDSGKELEAVEVSVKESESNKEVETRGASVKDSESDKELETVRVSEKRESSDESGTDQNPDGGYKTGIENPAFEGDNHL